MEKSIIKKKATEYGDVYLGNCLEVMRSLPERSIDLVFGSPPYEDRRTYAELQFALKGQDWVDWMVTVVRESLRICRGLVAFVLEGKTENYQWSATPALLMADLHRAGVVLRKPPIYKRQGVMGSGGPDWLRNDYEFIVCATNEAGRLPWSDNTACGHPPKCGPYGVGGMPSHRNKDDTRVNDKQRKKLNELRSQGLSQRTAARALGIKPRGGVSGTDDTGLVVGNTYIPPELSNPGNVVDCGSLGGGKLGSNIAHDNEAPFPEKLPDRFIRSFCPPGGVVLDPFGGSGTTASVAVQTGRRFITCDLRSSQIRLILRRLEQARRKRGLGL